MEAHRWFVFQDTPDRIMDWNLDAGEGIWRHPGTGTFSSLTLHSLAWYVTHAVEVPAPEWAPDSLFRLQEGL